MKRSKQKFSNYKINLAKYLLLIFLVILLLSGIYYVLKITNSKLDIFSSTGWKNEKTEYVTPKIGNPIFLKGFTADEKDQNKLIPLTIDNEEITLSVDGLYLQEDNKRGIELEKCKSQTFTVTKVSKAKLYTCTMDTGISWLISYMDNGTLEIVTTTWSGL